MSTAIAVINIVAAVVSVAASVIGAVVARKALGNSVPAPDLRKHPTADEGAPAAWLFGPFNRVSGQIIYLQTIQLVPIGGEEKGKSKQITVWNYKCNVAIAWCRNECHPTNPVKRIWASGELIFSESTSFSIDLTGINLTKRTDWAAFPGIGVPMPLGNFYCRPAQDPMERRSIESQYMTFTTVKGSIEDDQLRSVQGQLSGIDITVTGTDDPTNSGVFPFLSLTNDDANPGSPTDTLWTLWLRRCSYDYPSAGEAVTPEDVCVPDGPTCNEAINDLNTPATIAFTVTGFSLYFKDINHYPGNSTQDVDPIILMDPGISSETLPAFRGTCYTSFEDLDITKWASTLPHFEAEIRTTVAQPFVKEVFDAVIARNEATTQYKTDTSELSSALFPIFGLQVLGPVPPSATLNTLMHVYDVEAQERLVQSGFNRTPENVLFFVPRDDIPVNVLDYDLTSARESGEPGRVHALVKRTTTDNLPNEFILDYTEFERDLQPGTTSFTVSTGGVRNTQKLTIPLVQTQPGADILCRQMLWKAIRFHDSIAFNLPPNQYGITEGDRLRLETPSDGLPIEARVARIEIGENGLLELECQIDDDLAYNQLEGGGYSDSDDTTVTIPGLGQIVFMDMAPLTVGDVSRFGLYIVNQIREITGSATYTVFVSLDKINWTQPLVLQGAGVVGHALTVLAPPDDEHQWDRANTVTVYLESNTALESVSQADVEMGVNWAYLGREIIGFMTATPVGVANPSEYVLSDLLRGRNNSESAMAGHFVDQTFVLLPPSNQAVAFVDLEPTVFMQTVYLALAPAGIPVDDASETIAIPAAETLRPYSVHGLWGFKRPNGDTCVFATTRTRVPFRLLSALVPPFVETGPVTDYFADVYWLNTPTTWEFLRTVLACQAPQNQIGFEYTSEEQVVDLVDTGKIPTPDPTVRFRFVIARTSDSIGPGRSVEFCIEDVGVEYDGSCEFD